MAAFLLGILLADRELHFRKELFGIISMAVD